MWIESHQSLLRHRKTNQAVRLLGCDRFKLIGHLHALWWWALDNAPSGQALADYEIVDGAEWDGNSKHFVESLASAGFIEALPDGDYLIHDWHTYAGKLIDRRKEAVKRTQEWRRRQQSEPSEPVTHNVPVTYAHVTADRTVPNLTVPNQDVARARAHADAREEGLEPEQSPTTTTELKLLNVLKNVKGYPFDYETDLAHIRNLAVDFPTIDLAHTIKSWSDAKTTKPLSGTSRPRAEQRNWCRKQSQWDTARAPATNGWDQDAADLIASYRRGGNG